ncbi:hypothetical protein E4U54_001782 [Claviceps lovelessii]|nr:hypothetical protein E4U54_001782 [Claviceps lovelessii]
MSAHGSDRQDDMAAVLGFRHRIDHIMRRGMAMRSAENAEFCDYSIGQTKQKMHIVIMRHNAAACKTEEQPHTLRRE